MSNYCIATSSTADLPRTWLDDHHIPFIPYSFTVNDREVVDDCREESRLKVYKGMRGGDLLKTSQINEYAYRDFFRDLLAKGQDVLFLDMSKAMSVSYENSLKAADAVRKEFPQQTLYVCDTRCISGGLGLLVMQAVRRMEQGASFREVIDWCEANKLRMAHRFTVDNLKYLKMGGRVSNASALIGSILDIKPVMYVPDEGTLNVVQKVRGRKNSLNAIVKAIVKDLDAMGDAAGTEFNILNADCVADAEYVRDEIRRVHPEIGTVTISQLGVVIGAHCGPGLLTVFYLCNKREPK